MSTATETMRPPEPPGLITWIRHNLFNNWYNGILTIVSILVVYWGVSGTARWIFVSADWRPVTQFPILYLVGQYPRDQLWRIGLILLSFSFLFGVSWGIWRGVLRTFAIGYAIALAAFALLPFISLSPTARLFILANPILVVLGSYIGRIRAIRGREGLVSWAVFVVVALLLLRGFENNPLLAKVTTTSWGGLVVTFILAIGGIVLSFPIGVLLALGRRSSLPVLSGFCTAFIELVRGVPLITILFMFSVILALFLPPEARIDRLVRALMGMTFFSAAYTAENVRGGLQAVPKGQIEAAQAIGLNGFQTMILIVLPQALRAVIPAIVGQFISLFKDTTLVVIVGINDLLGIARSILNTDPQFVRLQAEVFIFIAAIFWIFSYLMSFASRRLEAALGVGRR